MLVTYDPEADATYVSLTDTPVAKTRQFGDSVSVDLDEVGSPVGVELLMTPASVTSGVLTPLLAELSQALRRGQGSPPAERPSDGVEPDALPANWRG